MIMAILALMLLTATVYLWIVSRGRLLEQPLIITGARESILTTE
jgi:hypothetical protein